MGDLDYVYAVARIRVKEKSLLGDMDISQLTGMPDAKSVIGYLEDKGWGDAASEGDPEAMLAAEENKTLQLIRELKVDPAVFDVLSYPNLYHNLKAGIKEMCTSEENAGAFYTIERYGREEMLRILKEQDYKALPVHMRDAAARAASVMLETHDGQKCDVIVDRACLDAMIAAGRKQKNKLLRNYVESTVAVTNIKVAVRALRTGKSLAFLKEALAPCRELDVRLLALSAAENEEALMNYLETHGFREAAEAYRESPSQFERWCDNRLIETIRPEKRNSVSAGPIIAYYLARLNEIKTVRIILTAKANGFPEDAIRQRVREMYV